MRKAFVAAGLMLLMASTSFGYRIVMDYDGDPMNGPDVITGQVSDEVTLYIYFIGEGIMIQSFGAYFCNYDESLEIVSSRYLNQYTVPVGIVPVSYGIVPLTEPEPNCYQLQGTDWGGTAPLMPPGLIMEVVVHLAVDCSVDLIEWDPENVAWTTLGSGVIVPEEMVGVQIIIGGTGTEESSWGAVKDLFR